MKKTYDWNISLNVNVQNNNKKLNIICSVHTNVHQLKLQIIKKLGLLVFDTDIDLYGGTNKNKPLKPTSSLQQNGIQGNSAVVAIIKRMKENKSLDIQVEENYDKKKAKEPVSDGFGLALRASCTNEKCVNFGEDIFVNYGYGNFPIYSLISDLKCEKCPYKNQYLRPVMICKDMKISKCCYRLSGTVIDLHMIPNKKQTKFLKCSEEKEIRKVIENGIKWEKDLILEIKPL